MGWGGLEEYPGWCLGIGNKQWNLSVLDVELRVVETRLGVDKELKGMNVVVERQEGEDKEKDRKQSFHEYNELKKNYS